MKQGETEMTPEEKKEFYGPQGNRDPEVEAAFTYHPPFGTQYDRYDGLRREAKKLAYQILINCPNSRERSLALRKLEESTMWANAAIARNEKET
jgi:hypothetical protein